MPRRRARLVERADVFLTNFLPDARERLDGAIDPKGGEKSKHKVPFDVTSPDFVHSKGVPYLDAAEIEGLRRESGGASRQTWSQSVTESRTADR